MPLPNDRIPQPTAADIPHIEDLIAQLEIAVSDLLTADHDHPEILGACDRLESLLRQMLPSAKQLLEALLTLRAACGQVRERHALGRGGCEDDPLGE